MELSNSQDGRGAPQPGPSSAFESQTFSLDMSIRVDQPVGSMSISPSGRDVVLASRQGLHIIDLDAPYSPPRHLPHRTPWEVADVQWSPFAARDYWVVSTSNQKALVWNLASKMPVNAIEHVLHAHTRAITDINFSAHHPDILATCAVDSFVHGWDLRSPSRPVLTFCDWFAGATQVKWNRQDSHIIASSHDKFLRIWDDRKGAYPLRSVEAHDTKIYGIDWNRTRSTGIITCSLDKSIKFWDYKLLEDTPERVVRTPFPVWRARHTPFGWGMLAMPQRGNTDLHLYDRRLAEGVGKDAVISPVHKFEGHEDQVKEFLWRPRGGIVDNIDDREFQLVTWGADRDLRLHRVDERILREVGYHKGREIRRNLNVTRKNATYKTFRDVNTKSMQTSPGRTAATAPVGSEPQASGGLKRVLSAGMKKAPIPLSKGWGFGGYSATSTGMQARQSSKKSVNAIDWMRGVKIGKKELDRGYSRGIGLDFMSAGIRAGEHWEFPESLGDEVTQVADKYGKVTFDHVDIQKRLASLSMNGPWGADKKAVYVRVDVKFPSEYPETCPPTFLLEKTSSIPQETLDKLVEGLRLISHFYASRHRGCLEAVSSYLLGERDLDESTAWFAEGGLNDVLDPDNLAGQLSSDDEEDNIDISQSSRAQDMDNSGTEITLGTIVSNANVPLPKACGAMFAKDGRLICFFPPRDDRAKGVIGPWFSKEGDRTNKTSKVFQGFGRLETGSPDNKVTILSSHEDQEVNDDSAEDSFTSSSDSLSSSEEDLLEPKLGGFPHWRKSRPRERVFPRAVSNDNSQLSVGQGSSILKALAPKPKNIVSIHKLDELIPAKKSLAEEYMIFGDGPSVCKHNSRVAERHGLSDIADFWELSELILHNKVPLEILEQPGYQEPILVVARRAANDMRRRDSGLDLAFDDAKTVLAGHLRGRTRWGHHPMGGQWLVEAMFSHFEQLADVQMLAMMSCVFVEPALSKASNVAMMDVGLRDRALPMKIPAFSLDYFPSVEMALSLKQPTISISSTPNLSDTPVGTYGSTGSSDGQWGSHFAAPHSTGTTPPSSYKNNRAVIARVNSRADSISTSPDRQYGRRSNASLSSVFTPSLTRGFPDVASSSPPTRSKKKRPAPVHATLGGLTPGGVTWGTNTFFAAPLEEAPMLASAACSESEAEEDEGQTNDRATIKVTLKNQNLFDGEGCTSVPLLNPTRAVRHKGYRESYANLLAIWRLELQRLEILKLNGLQNAQSADQHQYQPLATASERQTDIKTSPAWKGLHIGGHCKLCGSRLQYQSHEGLLGRCSHCAKIQRKLACAICMEVIVGTYAPCFACGHVTHALCHRAWFTQMQRECPTGCGCQCTRLALSTPKAITDQQSVTGDGEVEDEGLLNQLPTEGEEAMKSWDEWEYLSVTGLGRGLGAGLAKGLNSLGRKSEGDSGRGTRVRLHREDTW